jgi:hypothetical protein
MIANFFRNLDARHVEYLLISGQASVLYGAATFSEDIDLWVNPTDENCRRLLAALRDSEARYYKLTPAPTVEHFQRGHGFHFILPGDDEPDVFLDIMGAPPRVGSFASALAAARSMDTEWGCLPTIGLPALVELKKTQRLEDYPIISKLALAWFDQSECEQTPADFRWAIENIFTLPELRMLLEEHPAVLEALPPNSAPGFKEFAERIVVGKDESEASATSVNADMQQRMAKLQQADRRYWRDIIAELKRLRAADELMPQGAKV